MRSGTRSSCSDSTRAAAAFRRVVRPSRLPAARRAPLNTIVAISGGPHRSRTARAILALSLAMALFVCNDVLVKLAAARLPASEIMTLRGAVGIPLIALLVWGSGGLAAFRFVRRIPVIVRGLIEAAIVLTFILAAAQASLAQVNTILQLSPLLLTVAAIRLLGERVGASLWLATLTGFFGVVLVVQPGLDGIDFATGMAVLSAVLVAGRDLYTRGIDARIPSFVVVLGTTMTVPLVGLAIAPLLDPWLWPTPTEAGLLAAAACFVALGNVFIVLAFRGGGEIAVIAPFRYSVVLWSMLSSVFVFGEMLNTAALIGAALIVGSGLFVWRADVLRRARG